MEAELFIISLFSWGDIEWNTKALPHSSFPWFKLVFCLLFHSVTMCFGGGGSSAILHRIHEVH